MSNVRIYIENKGFLDINKNLDFPLNFSISDIKEPDKKNSTFSKVITLPGTINNNKILGELYDLNTSNRNTDTLGVDNFNNLISSMSSFNTNEVIKCSLYVDDELWLDDMIFTLKSVRRNESVSLDVENIEYDIQVSGNQSDFFNNIKVKTLNDIEWVEGTDIDEIPDMSDTDKFILDPIMIHNNRFNNYEDGWKLMAPTLIDGFRWVQQYKVGIYLWKYWNKIISDSGYRYTFDDIGVENSVLVDDNIDEFDFRKIYIPFLDKPRGKKYQELEYNYVQGRYRMAPVDNQELLIPSPYSLNSNISSTDPVNGVPFNRNNLSLPSTYESPVLNLDLINNNNLYDPVNNVYVCNFIGILKIKNEHKDYSAYIFNDHQRVATFADDNGRYEFEIVDVVYVNGIEVARQSTQNGNYIYKKTMNGVTQYIPGNDIINLDTLNGTTFNGTTNFNINVNYGDTVGVMTFMKVNIPSVSDSIMYYYNQSGGNYTITQNVGFNVGYRMQSAKEGTTRTYTASSDNYGMYIGNMIDLNDYTLRDVKQSDFISDIMTMFNLYVYQDKNDPHLLHFKQRDKFYEEGKVLDWSSKFIKDKEYKIDLLSEVTKRDILFKYKDGSTDLLKQYKTVFVDEYGSAKYRLGNKNLTDEEKVELRVFEPAALVKKENYNNNQWFIDYKEGQKLILYDLGYSDIYAQDNPFYDGRYGIRWGIAMTQIYLGGYPWSVGMPGYPVFSHYNNFGVKQGLGHTADEITQNLNWGRLKGTWVDQVVEDKGYSLISRYAKLLYQRENSRMMTCFLNLKPEDIAPLILNERIYINGQYWFINRIIDYNPTKTFITKVELIETQSYEESVGGLINNSTDDIEVIEYISDTGGNSSSSGGTGGSSSGSGGGNTTIINQTPDNCITGTGNIALNGSKCNVIKGNNNKFDGYGNAIIGTDNDLIGSANHLVGWDNDVESSGSIIRGNQNNISESEVFLIGSNNDVYLGTRAVVIGGDNDIDNAFAVILGTENELDYSRYNIVLGDQNKINKYSTRNILIGDESELGESSFNNIIAVNDLYSQNLRYVNILGKEHNISGDLRYGIINGEENDIFKVTDNITINGNNNSAVDVDNITIFGNDNNVNHNHNHIFRDNITTDEDGKMYVDKLNINTIKSTPSIKGLGVDVNGDVTEFIPGIVQPFVKLGAPTMNLDFINDPVDIIILNSGIFAVNTTINIPDGLYGGQKLEIHFRFHSSNVTHTLNIDNYFNGTDQIIGFSKNFVQANGDCVGFVELTWVNSGWTAVHHKDVL